MKMNSHPAWLSQIAYGKIRICLEAKESARLSSFTENVIRGWLGPALLRVEFCSFLQERPCPPCISPASCTFHYFFEGKTVHATKPFVIEIIRPRDKWEIRPGEILEIDLTLIGDGTLHQDKVAVAFMRFNNEVRIFRSLFKLVSVNSITADGSMTAYQVGKRQLISIESLAATEHFAQLLEARAIRVNYQTPTALLQQGELLKAKENLTFEFLVRRLMRRLYQLATDHCGFNGGKVNVDDLIEASRKIEQVDAELRWREYDRYSRRQEQELAFGGYVGWQIFWGDLGRFAPLLALGEQLHVGKRATFGFGRLMIEVLSDAQ
jgi:hypothetical protein